MIHDSREVLENNPARMEWNLHRLPLILLPFQDVVHILRLDLKMITVTHSRFQQNSDGIRQTICEKVNDNFVKRCPISTPKKCKITGLKSST